MSNVQKIYSDAIGRKPKVENGVLKTPEDLMSLQAKINWLADSVTQETFSSLRDRIKELEEQARLSACSYHQHNNHQQIIGLLIRADELRKILDTYASAK